MKKRTKRIGQRQKSNYHGGRIKVQRTLALHPHPGSPGAYWHTELPSMGWNGWGRVCISPTSLKHQMWAALGKVIGRGDCSLGEAVPEMSLQLKAACWPHSARVLASISARPWGHTCPSPSWERAVEWKEKDRNKGRSGFENGDTGAILERGASNGNSSVYGEMPVIGGEIDDETKC